MAAAGDLTRVDHAIFTSTTSMSGQGYRVVASSADVTADEKKAIAQASPSHGAMSDSSDAALGVAFYEVGPDRYCVAQSHHSGQEQTGRGGMRVLTHSFILDADGMQAFGWNPFAVLRTPGVRDAVTLDHRESGSLDPVDVFASDPTRVAAVEQAFDLFKTPELVYVLDRVMNDGCLILPGMIDRAIGLVEGLLLSMPECLRHECTFSIGIDFALTRRRRIVLIGPDATKTQRLVRGQQCTVVLDLAAKAASNAPDARWPAMVVDCRKTQQIEQLLELEAMPFDEASLDALDCVADRMIKLNHIDSETTEALLETLWPAVKPEMCNIERVLDDRFTRGARRRVLDRLNPNNADNGDEVERHWETLIGLGDADPEIAKLCLDLHERTPTLSPAPPGAECVPAAPNTDNEEPTSQ